MKAIAWDDEPEDYLKYLTKHLVEQSREDGDPVELSSYETLDAFKRAFEGTPDQWDFVVTDLIEADHPAVGEDEETGRAVIQFVRERSNIPIFVITRFFHVIRRSALGEYSNVTIKSKSTRQAWMANEILEELRRLGIRATPGWTSVVSGFCSADECGRFKERILEVSEKVCDDSDDVEDLQRCGSYLVPVSEPSQLDSESGLLNLGGILRLRRGRERVVVVDLAEIRDAEPEIITSLRDARAGWKGRFSPELAAALDEIRSL